MTAARGGVRQAPPTWLMPVAAVAVTVAIWTQVRSDRAPRLDRWARGWASEHRNDTLFSALNVVKTAGYLPYVASVMLIVAALVSIAQRSPRALLSTGLAFAGVVAVTLPLKALVGRRGPSGVGPPAVDGAWPSTHGTTAVVAAMLVVTIIHGRGASRALVAAIAAVATGAVGFALVYCGHHWLSDVVVAVPLGYLIVRAADQLTGVLQRLAGWETAPSPVPAGVLRP